MGVTTATETSYVWPVETQPLHDLYRKSFDLATLAVIENILRK